MPDPVIISGPADFKDRFHVSRETIDRLTIYAEELKRWQKAVNLVAPGTLGQIWHRHFADSAQLADMIPPDSTQHADLGSGGGFPGLVLAIMLADRSAPPTTRLIESDQRKAAFLRETARRAGIAVEIVTARIENPETHAKVGIVDVVSARALAPLDRLLQLSAPLFGDATVGFFLKGRGVEQELTDAGHKWRFEHRLVPSVTQEGAYVVAVRHLQAGSSPR